MDAFDFPPPPWRLNGEALCAVRTVTLDCARKLVPEGLRIVRAGRSTVGLLALVRYGAGSTLEYEEAIVAPALVYAQRRIGWWVSHIYVNHPQSLDAGRRIWGLPKQLASFERRGPRVRMDAPGVCIEIDGGSPSVSTPPLPLAAAVFGAGDGLKWSLAMGIARASVLRAAVHVTAPELEELQFERAQRVLRLAPFDVRLAAPRRCRGARR
jgi:hypothetical protein